jgi:hypothetical protein
VAKLSDKWSGLLAQLLTIYPPFQKRSGQAVRQVEWTTSQAAHYLSPLFRREVAKLSDKWSGLLARLLSIYPLFLERSGQLTSGMGY